MEFLILVVAFAACIVGLNRLNNYGVRRERVRHEPASKDSRWQ